MTIIYRGWRNGVGAHVRLITETRRTLPARRDLSNHSPDGFEWGYAGSGPAQLALAILAHALNDDERALRLHQAFKAKVVARLPRTGAEWELTREQVLKLADECDAEREAGPREQQQASA